MRRLALVGATLLTLGAWVPGLAIADQTTEASLAFQVSGTALFEGPILTDILAAGFVISEPGPNLEYRIRGEGNYYVVNAPEVIATYDTPVTGNRSYAYAEEAHLLESGTLSGEVSLSQAHSDLSIRLLPLVEARSIRALVDGGSSLEVGIAKAGRSLGQVDAIRAAGDLLDHDTWPARDFGSVRLPFDRVLDISEGLFAVHWSGDFLLPDGRTISASVQRNESRSIADPTRSVSYDVFDRICLIITGPDLVAKIRGASFAADAYPDSMSVQSDGSVSFVGVEGAYHHDGEDATLHGGLLKLQGPSNTTIRFGPDGRNVDAQGRYRAMELDGKALLASLPIPPTSPVPMMAGAIGAAAAASLLLSGPGQKLLSWFMWNATTPLGNPVRRQILERIRADPGMTQVQISRQLGHVHRRFARYHLQFLLRGHLIDAVRFENKTVYVPNAGTFTGHFQVDGRTLEIGYAVAALSHPRRRAIFEILKAKGPCDFGTISDAWLENLDRGSPPSQANFYFHAQKMQRAGVLRKEKSNGRVWWRVEDVIADRMRRSRELLSKVSSSS